MIIYYAHPVSHYNTYLEKEGLKAISKCFPEPTIYNPNNEADSERYKLCGMDYFKLLASKCDIVVGQGFIDGEIPHGVYSEMLAGYESGKKVYYMKDMDLDLPMIIEVDVKSIKTLSINETRDRIRNGIK